MNEKEMHNNPWAEKLHNLPVPDVNKAWQDMHLMLDQQMPVAKQDKRWIYWLLFLLLLIGVCTVPGIWKQVDSPHVGKGLQPGDESPIVRIEVEDAETGEQVFDDDEKKEAIAGKQVA